MAKITRRAALLSVIGIGAGAGIGIGVAVSSKGTPSAEPIASPSTETAAPTPSATPTPTPSPSPSPSVDTRPRWPLTGKLLKEPGQAHHAAVAVKVPDNQNEHPQRGLDQADIVFVELDGYRDASGYSGTRLVPVFHSHDGRHRRAGPLDPAGRRPAAQPDRTRSSATPAPRRG